MISTFSVILRLSYVIMHLILDVKWMGKNRQGRQKDGNQCEFKPLIKPMAIQSTKKTITIILVSYTHLDVYKRQIL